ncbi:MAG: hypothetical protein GWN62_15185 [Aliifodinibius sp.]|nr:hypothetical protein [Fodinibius sp.]
MTTILFVFVLLGVTLPFINQEFGENPNNINTEGIDEIIADDGVNALDVVLSVFTIFFWTFGALPFWLDGILLVPRIMLAVISFQLIRGS